jgi:hypothetical protein
MDMDEACHHYLHTQEQQRKLVSAVIGKVFAGKDVLLAVRRSFFDRKNEYKNSVREADRLPSALLRVMKRDDIGEVDYMDDQVAINTINRCLKNARQIIEAVRDGRFPE